MTRAALLLAALAFAGSAFCQAYPNRPVKVVVPWPPGQATDLSARIIADKLSQSMSQAFVIENKPGAGGQIGTEQVVKSPADGYTLLASSSGPISIMPNLQKVSYDPLKDLAPIGVIGVTPFALVTHPSFPAANAKEFIALLRANPDKHTFSSSGTGATAHLFVELFNSMAQIKARHVPYKGSAPALTDVINGQISYTLETVAATVGHIKSGRLKTFGVTTARRSAALPDVPPLAEAGEIPGFDTAGWVGYSAPAGTPREIVVRISAEIQKALQASDVRERYVALGLEAIPMSPDEMSTFLKREQERYGTIIRNANIKID